MNKGQYVGFTYFGDKKHYLKVDGFFSLDINEARRFQSAGEAISATNLDGNMITFAEQVEDQKHMEGSEYEQDQRSDNTDTEGTSSTGD